MIYRGLADDGVDSSDLRKVSTHNAMTHGGMASKQVLLLIVMGVHYSVKLKVFDKDCVIR